MSFDFIRAKRSPRPMSFIPLISIMFVLILFFMIAGHLEKIQIIEVDLPMADSGQMIDEGPIEIMLGKRDEVIINDEMRSTSEVLAELKNQLATNPERVITIKADAALEANKLVDLMQMVRDAGGVNLSLITESSSL
ncbi:MAG: biopolymer transporter ExbD [Alphaproteobacteria bacterium]|nr:biopolymer transporter ExbD [Alphaproteobacteria bacterium]